LRYWDTLAIYQYHFNIPISFKYPNISFSLRYLSLFVYHFSFITFHSKKMYILLISIVWGIFAAMLFLNIYIRVKAFKYYRKLVDARVEFGASHIFNQEKMEKEIYPKYPNSRADIDAFVHHVRKSMRMATVLIALITLFGGILMWYRHE
jgi:hypothetical protein